MCRLVQSSSVLVEDSSCSPNVLSRSVQALPASPQGGFCPLSRRSCGRRRRRALLILGGGQAVGTGTVWYLPSFIETFMRTQIQTPNGKVLAYLGGCCLPGGVLHQLSPPTNPPTKADSRLIADGTGSPCPGPGSSPDPQQLLQPVSCVSIVWQRRQK